MVFPGRRGETTRAQLGHPTYSESFFGEGNSKSTFLQADWGSAQSETIYLLDKRFIG
jgi:hypothetical protein